MFEDDDETTRYHVVMNHEEQYSLWPVGREMPLGWKAVGKEGIKKECLAYIKEVWTDMRPLSLRQKMEEDARRREVLKKQGIDPDRPPDTASQEPELDPLPVRLSRGDHPVEVGLRPERTVNEFKAAIDRGYVHIKFTTTRGGTELGVRLDTVASDFTTADFTNGKGRAHIEGTLTLDYHRVRCIADIDLATLAGTGHLQVLEKA